MGGGYYDRDVYEAAPINVAANVGGGGAARVIDYSVKANEVLKKNTDLHPSMDPRKWASSRLKCNKRNPIVFALDVTGSMGDWTKVLKIFKYKVIYDKMPMFFGQLLMKGYLDEPSISFCAIGDHKADNAPLQVAEFGEGKELDARIEKMYLEGAGGAGITEFYELAAYFYIKYCDMSNCDAAFFFITGDETFYDVITAGTMEEVLGVKGEKVEAEQVWANLKKKYNVFLLHKPYEEEERDKKVLDKWGKVLEAERILVLETAKACVDVMLGAIAITSGARTLGTYLEDLRSRGQTEDRIIEVKNALKLYGENFKPEMVVRFGDLPKEYFLMEARKEVIPKLKNIVLSKDEMEYRKGLSVLRDKMAAEIPKEFVCPITDDLMQEPGLCEDNRNYEKKALEIWFEKHDTSPSTNSKMKSRNVFPNIALKKLIREFYETNKNKIGMKNPEPQPQHNIGMKNPEPQHNIGIKNPEHQHNIGMKNPEPEPKLEEEDNSNLDY